MESRSEKGSWKFTHRNTMISIYDCNEIKGLDIQDGSVRVNPYYDIEDYFYNIYYDNLVWSMILFNLGIL